MPNVRTTTTTTTTVNHPILHCHGSELMKTKRQTPIKRLITPYSSDDTYCNVNATSPIVRTRAQRQMSDSAIKIPTGLIDDGSTSNSKNGSNRSSENSLLKEAFRCKAAIARSFQENIVAHESAMQDHDDLMTDATTKIDLLKGKHSGDKAEVIELISKRELLEEEKQRLIDRHTTLLDEKNAKNQDAIKAMENIVADRDNTGSILAALQAKMNICL